MGQYKMRGHTLRV